MPYNPPDDKQLINFIAVTVLGRLGTDNENEIITSIVLQSPILKLTWMERHQEFQERIDSVSQM